MVLMELAVTVAVLTVKVLLEFIREQLQLLEMNAQLAAAVRVPVQETANPYTRQCTDHWSLVNEHTQAACCNMLINGL